MPFRVYFPTIISQTDLSIFGQKHSYITQQPVLKPHFTRANAVCLGPSCSPRVKRSAQLTVRDSGLVTYHIRLFPKLLGRLGKLVL